MEKVTGEGGWIRLGPWGPERWSRTSRCEASYKADGPVMEITVYYSQLSPVSDKESIDAISFQSKSRDVVVLGCSEIGSSCCQRKVRIDRSVEQLLFISLTYNDFYLTSLTFHTNRNKYGPIGPFHDKKDATFSMPMDVGVDIVGFHGCGEVDHGNRLIAIGVFVEPKVKSLHSIQDPYAMQSTDKKIEENVDDFVMKMKEADAKNEELRKRNEETEKEVVHLQKREEELKEELKELKAKSKDLKLKNKAVKKENKEVEAENEVMRKKNKETEKKVDDLQKIEEEFKIEVKELKKKIEDVAAKNEVLEQRNEVMIFIDSSVEQLRSISLTTKNEQSISSLCFYSTRAKYGPYGTECGRALSISIEGGVLAGFHGRFETYLNAIGIIVASMQSTQ